MADNTNIMNNPAASESRAFTNVMERLENGFNTMTDADKIDSIKSQIANGYIPPELRIGTDIKSDIPDGMGFSDRNEINKIRTMTSGGTDRNGNEIKDETSLGLGRDFAANLGINTSEMHYVKDAVTGEKLDIKDNISANMSPEYATEVKSVYVMNDYSKNHRSEFIINSEGKEKHIPFQDLRITTFIFEKYDGTTDYSAYYTNESGYKLGDVPDTYLEGFNWEGKLPAIDDFSDKLYTHNGIDYSSVKDNVEAFAMAKVAETKESIYLSQMEKIEAQKDERKEIEEVFKDRMEAVKMVYNGISARFDEMGEVLSGIKSEIYSARDNCIIAEKSGNKADIEEAKGELIDKIKTYLDTRNSFESELSKADMDYVKGELISSEKSYVNVRDYNERTYGDASKEIRNPDSKTYDIDNKFVFATDSTKGVLIAESRNSHDLRNLNNEKIENAAEAGIDYLEAKVGDWNVAHPDNKLSINENGIVTNSEGKEYLSYFREGVNYTDNESDGFIRVADLDDFHFDSPRDILESIFLQEGTSSDISSYEKDLMKSLSGYEQEIRVEKNADNGDDDSLTNDLNLLTSGGIKSENDIYRVDAHVNPKGDISISATKLNEIKADVLKSLGVDIDRYSERKAELSKGVSLNDSEMESVKNSTLKEIKGNFSTYESTRDNLSGIYKDRLNRTEIYSKLGVDINKVNDLMIEKIGTTTLSDRQMKDIEDQSNREGKGDADRTAQIKSELIQEKKEYNAEKNARHELGINDKDYFNIRNELRDNTVIPDNERADIESRARNIAGYNEDRYLETLSKNTEIAKNNKVEGTLNKEFHVNPKDFESRVGKEVSKVSNDLQKSADKIAKYSKNLDRLSIFGRLNGTNLDFNIDKYRLHKEVNNYIAKGGAIGEDKIVRSEYKMVEKFVDIVGILKSNYWETLIFRGLAKIQDKIDARENKIENDNKDKVTKNDTPPTAPDNKDNNKDVDRSESFRSRISHMISRDHYKDKADNTENKTTKNEEDPSDKDNKDQIDNDTDREPDNTVITEDEKNTDNKENDIEKDEEPEDKTLSEDADNDDVEQKNEDLVPDDIDSDSDETDADAEKDIGTDSSDALDTESDKDKDKDSADNEDSDRTDNDNQDREQEKNDTDKDDDKDDKDSIDNDKDEDNDRIESESSDTEADNIEPDDNNIDIQPDEQPDDTADDDTSFETDDLDNEVSEPETVDEEESEEAVTSDTEEPNEEVIQDDEEPDDEVAEESKDDDATAIDEEPDDSGAVEHDESEDDDKTVQEEADKESIEDDNKDDDKDEKTVEIDDDAAVVNEGEGEKVSEDKADSEETEAKDVIAESTGGDTDNKENEKDNDIDPDENEEVKKKFEDIVNDFLDGKDTLTDNLADFLKDQILNPFDLIESFAECIVDFIKDLSAGDIAGALDSVADMISLKYGDGVGDLADKFFDKLTDNGVDSSTVNEISNQYEGILEEKAPELQVEGNIGAADMSPEGTSLTGFEETSLEQISQDAMTEFAQPDVIEPLINDIDLSDKVDSISNYINDNIENGIFTVPDGIELTGADINNIANDIVNNAVNMGEIQVGSDGTEIGDYWPDDSVIGNQISSYEPSEYQSQPDTEPMTAENDFVENDTPDMRDPFEGVDTLNNTEASQVSEGAIEGASGMENAIEGAESLIDSVGGLDELAALLL